MVFSLVFRQKLSYKGTKNMQQKWHKQAAGSGVTSDGVTTKRGFTRKKTRINADSYDS